MTLRHFRIFITVAEKESITQAAQLLSVSQPTVSVAIRELEEHYGRPFFERMNQRLKITSDGLALLSYAKHLIQLTDEIEQSFQDPDRRKSLRIGGSINVGVSLLPRWIRQYQSQHPEIEVQVQINTTDFIEKQLLENELDLALVGGPLHSPFLIHQPVLKEKQTVVCGKTFPLANQAVTLQELASYPLLFRQRRSGAFEVLEAALTEAGLTVHPQWESASLEALLEAARQNLGVTILPYALAVREIENQRLAEVTVTDFRFENLISLVWHKQKYKSPAMLEFIRLIEKSSKGEA
ncbi:LysR family transcriptional regulator [Holdemania massiliensis]|uniref:LysR family transcriptional regulator n=1 Tax=Holdemania massiliensis TaxID=1468449 RepID=UPI001F065770|nr:LysR family transcriptional regulator [Holdemania massiliensis]MCH1940101.1 LysR family transcriptional regulator [Holdemania massiliensis]